VSTLTPRNAAAIARGVYYLLDKSVEQAQGRGLSLGCEGMFTVSDDSRFLGRSGGLMVCKTLSGFGYIAAGEGQYKDEVLIATRGTKSGFDWLTNLNIGLQIGPGGQLVHAGFNETWKSFSADVTSFLRGRNPSVIHCVGHSLGGALATLNADYLSSIRAAEIKLYTFGSPRTGDMFFARSLSRRVTEQNMYRVHHRSDPVPKIPLFPFQHVPAKASGYQIMAGPSGLINPTAHFMVDSYIPGVADMSWQALGHQPTSDEVEVQGWLGQMNAGGGGFLKGSAALLQMIGKAMAWILGKIAFVAVGAVFTAGVTVLDQMAWMLSTGAQASVEVSMYISTIIGAIFRFLGRTAVAGASLTTSFIRWVLDLLYASLAAVARTALTLLC
jgi:triacylglycerol lipase